MKQWEGDHTDHCRDGDQQRIADLGAEQGDEGGGRDEGGQPIADGDLSKEHAGPENGSDCGGIGAVRAALAPQIEVLLTELAGRKCGEP